MAKVKRRAVAHNALPTFLGKFQHPFTVEEAFIDCKEMSKNYEHGLIPLVDIAAAVDAKVPSCPGCMTTLAESYEQLSTSSVIKLTKENGQ